MVFYKEKNVLVLSGVQRKVFLRIINLSSFKVRDLVKKEVGSKTAVYKVINRFLDFGLIKFNPPTSFNETTSFTVVKEYRNMFKVFSKNQKLDNVFFLLEGDFE